MNRIAVIGILIGVRWKNDVGGYSDPACVTDTWNPVLLAVKRLVTAGGFQHTLAGARAG